MINIDLYSKFKNLSDTNINSAKEEDVKIHIVVEILRLLGHTSSIDFETNYKSDRPDIILRGLKQPVIIEVKAPITNINDHIDQIKRYSYNFDSFISVLTNGKIFYFFSPYMRKRKDFMDKLILSFRLEDLSKKEIVDKIASLLSKDNSYEQAYSNLESIEKAIENTETEISNKEKSKSDKEKKIAEIENKYSNLEDLIKVMEHLNPNIKNELQAYKDEKENIERLCGEIKELKNSLPKRMIVSGNYNFGPTIKRDYTERRGLYKNTGKDFELGYSNETLNILAVQKGKQIIICGHKKLSNNKVFLLSFQNFESDNFTPSEHGKKMKDSYEQETCFSYGKDSGYLIKESIESKYVAVVDYIENVPGKNIEFLKELYDLGEFNLWDIEEGPLKYFQTSVMRGIFLLLRVYEMPFTIKKGEDFSYIWNGKTQRKPKLINERTRAKIAEDFYNNKFVPVLTDEEYNKRVNKIKSIVNKYR